jgi:hypothetical protein
MKKVGRNDPCPCGSGKKFKKCHMGREDELSLESLGEFSEEMSSWITGLPEVDYGRSREIADALHIKDLSGQDIGIKFIDLKSYNDLNIFGGTTPKAEKGASGGVFVNLYKTRKTDPNHIYIAISPDIDDSSLIHQIAHVLDYLSGSNLMPGTLQPLSYEYDIPVEHLEHTRDFGFWLHKLQKQFDIRLDADDMIIDFLFESEALIEAETVKQKNAFLLKAKSDHMLKFLSEKSGEINEMIKDREGYIGSREEISEDS